MDTVNIGTDRNRAWVAAGDYVHRVINPGITKNGKVEWSCRRIQEVYPHAEHPGVKLEGERMGVGGLTLCAGPECKLRPMPGTKLP